MMTWQRRCRLVLLATEDFLNSKHVRYVSFCFMRSPALLPHFSSLPHPLLSLPLCSLSLCPLLPLSIIYLLVNRSKAEQLIKFVYSGPSRSSKYPHSFPWSIFCYILLLNTLVLYFCYIVLFLLLLLFLF